jgi:hypothetical protein
MIGNSHQAAAEHVRVELDESVEARNRDADVTE